MDAILVLKAPLDVDLSPLTAHLWHAKIGHRVIIDVDEQCLWLASVDDVEQVGIWLASWHKGELAAPVAQEPLAWQIKWQQGLLFFSQHPISILMLVAVLLVFFALHLGFMPVDWLLLQSSEVSVADRVAGFGRQQIYLLWASSVLHLSFIALLMNALWWWMLAKEIERVDGKRWLLSLVFLLAAVSAYVQYLAVGVALSGLAGINYGLMAWVWCRQRRITKQLGLSFQGQNFPPVYPLPAWLFPIMMVTLTAFLFIDTLSGGGGRGRESELAGAISGACLAYLWPLNHTKIRLFLGKYSK